MYVFYYFLIYFSIEKDFCSCVPKRANFYAKLIVC